MSRPWKFMKKRVESIINILFSLIWFSSTNLSSFTHRIQLSFFPHPWLCTWSFKPAAFWSASTCEKVGLSINFFKKSPVSVVIFSCLFSFMVKKTNILFLGLKIDFLESQYLRLEDHFPPFILVYGHGNMMGIPICGLTVVNSHETDRTKPPVQSAWVFADFADC